MHAQLQQDNESDKAFYARLHAQDRAEQAYETLVQDLKAIEESTGFYLTDGNVDLENVDSTLVIGTIEYWNNMYRCAADAAGFRASEENSCINKLLGRNVF